MRKYLASSILISLVLTLVMAANGAYAQNADAEDESSPSAAAQTDSDKEAPALPPAKIAAAPTEAIASSSDIETLARIDQLETAIAKFRDMGVGVAPFEQAAEQARSLVVNEHKNAEADAILQSLKRGLEDQQRRFYANKMQVWQNQRKPHNKGAFQNSSSQSSRASSSSNAAAGLSKGAHGVLSRDKGGYTPLIYPIAR